MSWAIVNVPLDSPEAVTGASETHRELVLQVVHDGWEPFGTADFGDGIVVSFRKWVEDEEDGSGLVQWPGYL